MSTNNYFVVPSARRPKPCVTETTTDPLVGKVVDAGDTRYVIVARCEVSSRMKSWKTSQRTIVPLPTGTFYCRARVEGSDGIDVLLRVEKEKVDDVVKLRGEVIDRADEEWIAVKVAKILESENTPNDVDWARFFFFDDTDPTSTLKAFDAAKLLSSSIAVYKPVSIPGPWSSAKLVGEGSLGAN